MIELVRNCQPEFKEYYIQMQAAKRSQVPLPSQVRKFPAWDCIWSTFLRVIETKEYLGELLYISQMHFPSTYLSFTVYNFLGELLYISQMHFPDTYLSYTVLVSIIIPNNLFVMVMLLVELLPIVLCSSLSIFNG